ncbi:MAG: tRNA (guanosine(46)-N7)-methyltransferase TrmB, partial [Pseudomonadales bacterium]|nr:tRNA (guanosine(46)-N7)-methyltransferase TrmB [Pseudomonadales bacterium]
PLVIEIGFGMGDSLLECAMSHPERNFIGIEVHRPGVGHLLIKAAEAGICNLKVINADSTTVMSLGFPPGSADVVQVFFPDPWHKKRHNKRRLLSAGFLDVLERVLKPGGILHVATDWEPYAASIASAAAEIPTFEATAAPPRPVTKYERRGQRLGHVVTDLAFKKRVPPASGVVDQ